MLGVFDQATINQVQQANDIVDVVSEHVNLRRKGREMVGLCPFHDDHAPSLCVNSDKQIFKCFACGAGGSVLTFVKMRENLTFPQAIERLAERAGIKLKTQNSKLKTAPPEVDPNDLAKVNTWAAGYFQQNLYDEKKGKYARDYITERHITTDCAKKWRLGLATPGQDDLLRAAKSKNIPVRLLEQAGLISSQQQDKFVNRLIFPITDVTGRVIGFGGRTLNETLRPGSGQAGPKYINSPTTVLFEKSNSLYGIEQARHQIVSTDTAVVVEGYTDCIMAHQNGCTNVVATLGTSFTESHGRVLRRYAKRVVLIFDSDIAGLEAANRALEVCLGQRIDVKLTSVPEGKDPCDFILANGRERFERLVNEADDVFKFKWNRLTERFGGDDTLTGRRQAVEEFLQTVATALKAGRLPAIDRGLMVNHLSGIIGLSSKQINAELSQRLRRLERTQADNAGDKNEQSIDWGHGVFAAAQREVLEVLLNEPNLIEAVKQKITADDFSVPILRQIAGLLFEASNDIINRATAGSSPCLRTVAAGAQTSQSLGMILAKAESVDLGGAGHSMAGAIAELAQTGEQKGNFKSRLADAMKLFQRHRAIKIKSQIKTVDDQREYLRRVTEHAEEHDPYNMGMIQ